MSITADSLPALLTPAEAADLLGRSRTWVYECVRRGSFLGVPVVKEAGRCFVPSAALTAYLRGETPDAARLERKVDALTTEVAALRRLLSGVFNIAAQAEAERAGQEGSR